MKALYQHTFLKTCLYCAGGLMALGLMPLNAAPRIPEAEAPRILGPTHKFIQEAEGKLVSLDRTRFIPYSVDQLKDTPFLLVYYSASWCPPCKAFTPELLNFYTRMKEQYGDIFELLLFSFDKKEIDMLNYMKAFKMPWPAIAYKELSNIQYLKSYQTPAIPSLILIDKNGMIGVDKFEYEGNKARSIHNEVLFERIEAIFKQYKETEKAS